MKGIIKDTLILFAITLIAGLMLGWVYDITKEPIEHQNQLKKENAYKAVFAGYEGFGGNVKFVDVNDEWFDGINRYLGAELGDNTANTLDGVAEAWNESGSTLLGYVFTVTNSEGYGGDIKLSVGILADGTVAGVEILSISETPGLGMNADKDNFKGQFANVKTDSFTFTKTGKKAPSEIDAISSATFTTRSMTNGVNAAIAAYRATQEFVRQETDGGAK